jgi:hypothetical protein
MRHLAMIVVTTSLVLAAADVAAAPTAFPAYEMVVVPSVAAGNLPTFFRINVTSGQVVFQSGAQFAVTQDSAALPPGDYHLYRTESLDRKGGWSMDRMDSGSGRTWDLNGGGNSPFVWAEITEPK